MSNISFPELLKVYIDNKIDSSVSVDIQNIEDYMLISQIYSIVERNSYISLSNKDLFFRLFSATDIPDEVLEMAFHVVKNNLHKLFLIKENISEEKNYIQKYNLNIEQGISHSNFQNYNESRLILELISKQDRSLYEISTDNAEKLLITLKTIYKSIS